MQDPVTGKVRKLRRAFNLPGHAHELTFSCYKRLPLLSKDRTREWFVSALDEARTKLGFELWAYVIMPEHVHVLLYPKRDNYSIADLLKAIKQPVSRNAITHLRVHAPHWLDQLKVTWPSGRVEYRFWQQGGGYDRNIYEPETAWASVNYLHENPVRRGLVSNALEWPWSSAGYYAGLEDFKLRIDDCPPDPA